MRFNKQLFKEISLLVLSFLIPFFVLIIIFAANNISLGSYNGNTIMMIDMQSEYIAYLRNLRHILLSNESLIYTNDKIFGGDYLSIFTFYLASPFNFFVVFFKEEAIPLFFLWSSIIKMAFASLNFYLLVRFTSKFTYQKIIFAIGYGLISYSFVYLSNYMWLDGVMILPLVILGLHFLKEKKHYWLYPLALAYSLMTSWYIGFMVVIFTTIYFLYLFFNDFNKEKPKPIRFLVRFLIFSLAGGLLSSTYWLTAFVHLSGTKGTMELPYIELYSITSFISGFMENNYADIQLIRLTNTYSPMFAGVVPLVFFMVFFFNKEFTLKERMILLGVFVFYVVVTLISGLYALMHGGREPTWFPTRYAFIISFLVCLLGSRSADHAHKLHPVYYTVPLGIGITAILIVAFTKHSEVISRYPLSVPSIIMYFLTVIFASLISYFSFYPIKKFDDWKITPNLTHFLSLLLFVQIASLYRGGGQIIRLNKNMKQFQKYDTYLSDCSLNSSFNNLKKYEKDNDNYPFFRMEATFNRPGNFNEVNNNPMFYNYNGLSHFSSSDKKVVQEYFHQLGFHDNWFFSKYDGGSTFTMNSLLGVKYLLEIEEQHDNFHPSFLDYGTFEKLDIKDSNNADFFKNNYALNLGFVSNKLEKPEISYKDLNRFEYQNKIIKSFVDNEDKNVFYPLSLTSVKTTLQYEIDEYGNQTYKNVKAGSTVDISYTTPTIGYDTPHYFFEENEVQDINYFIDGQLMEVNSYWSNSIHSYRDTKSHYHHLKFEFEDDYDEITLKPCLYYEDVSIAKEYLSKLKEGEFVVSKINNSLTSKSYEGIIDIKDNNKDLIFTLPFEGGIHVYVDGKLAKPSTKWNVFTGIDLSKYEIGKHTIKIEYQDIAFTLALPISITSLLGIFPLVIFYDKFENLLFKKRKEEK